MNSEPPLEVIGRQLLDQTRQGQIAWREEWTRPDGVRLGFPAYVCSTDEGTVMVDHWLGGTVLIVPGENGGRVDGSAKHWMAIPDEKGFTSAEAMRQENLVHPPGPPYSEGFPAVLDELLEAVKRSVG